jgi:DNA repair exonuclease SbcCD ATPase subunit
MKIAALRLHNVKRFAGVGVAIEGIGDGVNVLCAANEFGKSTSFEALHALFFQPYSSISGEVRNLRPYSGGNPLVEADIATEAGRFRIAKQFYGGRSARVIDLANGRLVAQADEAEDFIAGLVRGGTAGPAGLLWVRQGITGMEKRSRTEEETEKQVRTSLLESVQGEIEAITGGRRMADIMAATEAALQRLVTPTGRPKVGERYAEAIDERDRLEREEGKLAADVAALREALDRRTAAARHLAALDRDDDRQARRQAIAAAETAFDAAKAQRETLRAAEAELRLARDRRDAATRELATLREALQRSRSLRDRLAAAEASRAAASERRRAATAAFAVAQAEADAAELREQEARERVARLDAALRAREVADRLDALETRLQAAEAARAEIEQAEAALALLVLPSGVIEELEGLDVTIARLRAVAEAGRPSVEIVYEAGVTAKATLDGIPLRDGQPQGYDGQALLALPGIGTITLRSGQTGKDGNGLRQAEAKRAALLGRLGLADLAAVRRRQVEAERKDGEVRAAKGRLSLLAPDGLPRLREMAAAARALGTDRLELKEDPAQLRALHAAAEAQRAAARLAMREAEPARTLADEDFVLAETSFASIAGERAHADAVAGPDETRAGREAALVADLAGLDADLAEREAALVFLKADAVDLAAAEAALRRVRSVAEAVEKDIARLREEIAGLSARIAAQADLAVEERWRETIDALGAARSRASAYEREVAVLQRLRAALETARSNARETFLGPVMAELRPLLGMLFADDVSITFDDRTLLPHKILRRGQEEEVERLSGGMREQLSVLTRLAFARLLAKDGRPAPVILDDALVYSDDDRIEKMFNALHRQARDQQIIVFSCRQRAFRELGGTVLQMTDWHPER